MDAAGLACGWFAHVPVQGAPLCRTVRNGAWRRRPYLRNETIVLLRKIGFLAEFG
ncbi:hypothetical protein bcgnr5379_63650 [Bacillus cereus]